MNILSALGLLAGLSSGAVGAAPQRATEPVPIKSELRPLVRSDSAAQVLFLVRTTLIALDQANATGNYSVLRDLGAPDFRDRNTAADLARIFSDTRARRLNLGLVAVVTPHISAEKVTEQHVLRIDGTLETRPYAISFSLLFEAVDGVWKIDGVSVAPLAIKPGG